MARKSLDFRGSHRLTREADLEAVRRTGKRMQTEYLEARVSASLLLHPRIGIVVPKYRHTVVSRNRVKRRLRDLVRIRLLPNPNIGNVDLLLRAKPSAYATTFEQLALDVDTIARWVPTAAARA